MFSDLLPLTPKFAISTLKPTHPDFITEMDQWYLSECDQGVYIEGELPIYYSWFIYWLLKTNINVKIQHTTEGNMTITTDNEEISFVTSSSCDKIYKRGYPCNISVSQIYRMRLLPTSLFFYQPTVIDIPLNINNIIQSALYSEDYLLNSDYLIHDKNDITIKFMMLYNSLQHKDEIIKTLEEMNGQHIIKEDYCLHLHPNEYLKTSPILYNDERALSIVMNASIYHIDDWFRPDVGPGWMYSRLEYYKNSNNLEELARWSQELSLSPLGDYYNDIKEYIDEI